MTKVYLLYRYEEAVVFGRPLGGCDVPADVGDRRTRGAHVTPLPDQPLDVGLYCAYCSSRPCSAAYYPYCSNDCAVRAACEDPTLQRVSLHDALAPVQRALRREHPDCFDRRGSPKVRHASEALATAHLDALVSRGVHRNAARLRVYACAHCKQADDTPFWHVGHAGTLS